MKKRLLIYFCLNVRIEKVDQWLRAHTALAKEPSSTANIHVGWLTTTCNSVPGDLVPSSGFPRHCIHVLIASQKPTHN